MGAFITIISDYGSNSPYLSALKGAIYAKIPEINIVDISHSIKPHDTLQAAYILKNAISDFPENTIHLIAVDADYMLYRQILIIQYRSHYYIGADNGLFPLLFDEKPDRILSVKNELINKEDLFPEKNIFTLLARNIINKVEFELYTEPSVIKNIKQNIAPVVEDNLIRGSIIFIDGYGNAITNISKELFLKRNKENKRFVIFYRKRQKISKMSKLYSDVKNGDELALFNESGLLEIAMNRGNAGQLLGLEEGNQIFIEFYD